MGSKNDSGLRTKKINTIEKIFILLIFLIAILFTRENYLIKNENIIVEMINIQTTVNGALAEPDNENATSNIKKTFKRRNEILNRSCLFWKKLKAANEKATINELKEIHLILQDLSRSRAKIAKILEPYEDIENTLDENQENSIDLRYSMYRGLWTIIYCRLFREI